MVTRAEEVLPAARAGLVGGLVGGGAMGAFVVLCALLAGRPLWLGEGEVRPELGAKAALVVLVLHLVVSLGWGLAFGLLAHGLTGPKLLLAAIGWGVLSFFGMVGVALPLVGLGSAAARQGVGLLVFEHLLFGFGLAVGVAAEPRGAHRPRRAKAEAEADARHVFLGTRHRHSTP